MAEEYNYLSGATVDFTRQYLFDTFLSGYTYLGFARKDWSWGQLSLVRIEQYDLNLSFPTDFIAYEGTPDLDKKYYDDNTYRVNTNIPIGSNRVYIAKIEKGFSGTPTLSDFIFLTDLEIGELYLRYMNKYWCMIEGLNPKHYFDDIDEYDYYLFNYTQSLETRFKILEMNPLHIPSMTMPVKLAYSTTNSNYPTTLVPEAGNLVRTININGEVYYTGLNGNFDIYSIVGDNPSQYWWFILDENNNIILDGMKFNEVVEINEPYKQEKVIVFKYTSLNGEDVYVSITTDTGLINNIAIWNESLPYNAAVPVADNNPPAIRYSYLQESMIYKSIFDVRGLSKIQQDEIKFCKYVENEEQEQNYINHGCTIETFIVNDITPTEVKYAVTDDYDLAMSLQFTNVMINKELDNVTPTADTYRILFICYKPKDKDGLLCVNNNYSESELFDLTKYEYDTGTLIYIAYKIPIFRQFIQGNETFKIII